MLPVKVLQQGDHVMTVCNSCRYCEAYCPVFPAMEQRLIFATGDLTYLANLCHNCGECLYACQYAPPHEFGINVPRALAEIRLASYQEYCWPKPLAVAFRRHGLVTTSVVSAAFGAFMLLSSNRGASQPNGDFYRVLSHDVMVTVFGGVALFVLAALVIGCTRFWRSMKGPAELPTSIPALMTALYAALTLRHLHSDDTDTDCTDNEESRSPWRRRFHQCTMYGFLLCFASTSVAAFYHSVLGWVAPYAYSSLPVILGTVGGLGLVVGPLGLVALKQRRDTALSDPSQRGLDMSFIALLLLTSVTGLALLILRDSASMGTLLIVHLAFVLTLFVTMPYGKFVHGIYRTAALIKYELESARDRLDEREPEVSLRPIQMLAGDAAVAEDPNFR
jgi:citrate/tricarballylate utilization protein